MILILRKEKYILGRNDLYFWGFGEMLVYFRDLGSRGKILLGSRGNYFQGSGEINALFSGIKGAQTPPPPWGASLLSMTTAYTNELRHDISNNLTF